MDKNKLNSIMTRIFLFTLLMSVVAGITTISNGESILGGGINTTTINANQVLVNGSAVLLTYTDTNTNVTSVQVTGTTTKTLNVEQTGLTNLTATWSDINTFNSSEDIQAVYYPTLSTYVNASAVPSLETDSAHDTCSEITGCVENAITTASTYTLLGTYANSSLLNSYTTTANLYGLFGTYANTSSVYTLLGSYANSSALSSYQTIAGEYTLLGTYANTSSVSSLLSTYANTTALSSYQTITAGSSLLSTYLNSSTAGTTYQPLEATLTDIADGTIAENLVNTANPWADNEVSDTLTASILTDDNTYAKVSGETFTGDVLMNANIDLNLSTTSQINWNSSIYEFVNASGCLVRVVGTTRVNQCP